MASRFSSLTLLSAAVLLLVHASARNLQQTQDMPLHGAASPTKAESPIVTTPLDDRKNFMFGGAASPTKAESPTVTTPLDDRKNFIFGGAAGVGGFMGMPGGSGPGLTLPLPSGTPLLGGTGGFGGLGGAMGLPGGGPIGGGSFPSSRGGLVSP